MSRSILMKLSKQKSLTEPSLEGRLVSVPQGKFSQFLGEDLHELRLSTEALSGEGLSLSLEALDAALVVADDALHTHSPDAALEAIEGVSSQLESLYEQASNESLLGNVGAAAGMAIGYQLGREFGPQIVQALKRFAVFIIRMFERIAAWLKEFFRDVLKPSIDKLKRRAVGQRSKIEMDIAMLQALGIAGYANDKRWHSHRTVEAIIREFSQGFDQLAKELSNRSSTFYMETVFQHLLGMDVGYVMQNGKLTIPRTNVALQGDSIEVDMSQALQALERHNQLLSTGNAQYFRLNSRVRTFESDVEKLLKQASSRTDFSTEDMENFKRGTKIGQQAALLFSQTCVLWTSVQSRICRAIDRESEKTL